MSRLDRATLRVTACRVSLEMIYITGLAAQSDCLSPVHQQVGSRDAEFMSDLMRLISLSFDHIINMRLLLDTNHISWWISEKYEANQSFHRSEAFVSLSSDISVSYAQFLRHVSSRLSHETSWPARYQSISTRRA